MDHRYTTLAAALVAAFSVQAAFAQSTPGQSSLPDVTVKGSSEAVYNPGHATTATKIDAPLRDIPQTVNVISQEMMRDKGVPRFLAAASMKASRVKGEGSFIAHEV